MPIRVLILSASAGAGHVRAADALLKVFRNDSRVALAESWDILKYTNKAFEHLYGKMYIDLVNKAPAVLGWLYELSDTPYKNDRARVIFEKLNAAPFIKALKTFCPDLVVCTHFTPAAILAWLNEGKKTALSPAVVVTDFDCHAMWLVRHYVKYFVAREETRVYLRKLGVPDESIRVTGIPIDPIFEQQKPKCETRAALHLEQDAFTVLVSAGGFGVGPVESLISGLLSLPGKVQIVAIAGRSEALRTRLCAMAEENRSTVRLMPVGFTDKMDEYMAAADILVGKPGGLTSSEALARGLPLCIVNPIPGQEERNSDYLLEAGAAIRCNNLPALSWKIEQLIANPSMLKSLRESAARIAQPRASRQIAEELIHD